MFRCYLLEPPCLQITKRVSDPTVPAKSKKRAKTWKKRKRLIALGLITGKRWRRRDISTSLFSKAISSMNLSTRRKRWSLMCWCPSLFEQRILYNAEVITKKSCPNTAQSATLLLKSRLLKRSKQKKKKQLFYPQDHNWTKEESPRRK